MSAIGTDALLLEGRWRFDRVLGQGAEGTVYLAYDVVSNTPCAVKVYDALVGQEPEHIAALVATEVAIGQKVGSPWLVRTIAFGLAPVAGGGSTAYVVMEFLKGRTLRAYLDKRGRAQNDDEARGILLNVLEAVDTLHRAGYVHLDLKPENIFLLDRDAIGPESPAVRIFDFASAAVAGAAQRRARGTPYYASPEVCVRSGDIGKASDVYSLGIITFELFVGRTPIQRGTAEQIVAVHAFGQLDAWPQTPFRYALGPVFRRATLREPWQRYADAGAMRKAVAAVAAG
jgi:serine/threonine protein kinase